MKLKNCPECGKLYLENATGMCMDCYKIEEMNESKIASYVRDHPNSTISKIHEATGVKESTILRMIHDGRFIDISAIFYPCQSCGEPIAEGRLCQKCKHTLQAQIETAEKKHPEPKGPGMYTNYYKNIKDHR